MVTASQPRIEPTTGCIASAICIIGTKWTALILRDLMSGPKRFCELERSVEKITPRILSQRLDYLEKQAIISVGTNGCYLLTAKGQDLLPILKQMATWGSKYPA